MKICLTSRFSPWDPKLNGISIFTHYIANYLANHNHDVTVIYTKPKRLLLELSVPYKIEWATQLISAGYVVTVAKALKKLVSKQNFDIVHGNGPEALLFPQILSKENTCLIMSSHYAEIWPLKVKGIFKLKYPLNSIPTRIIHKLEITFEKFVCQRANHLIVFSDYSKRTLCKKYKIKENKIEVIPIGVDVKTFKARNRSIKENKLLFCGRLVEQKGVDILLMALKKVAKVYKDVRLIIIGDGPGREEYIRLCESLGISNRVKFLGYVPHHCLVQYYNNAKLFVLPSRSESFGIVLAEAMACGLPVVSTNIGAIPEVVENRKTGFLVPPEDPEALAYSITKLLDNNPLRRRVGLAGIRTVREKFSLDKNINKIIGVYKRCMHNNK